MPPSRARLTALAGETGFREETLEKVIRLGELAMDVGHHPLLSRVLLLKGGTALNLAFGSPARLSVDLDFNYVGSPDRAGTLKERPEVERAVAVVTEGRGYSAQWSADEHAGRKCYLRFESAAGTPDRIEIDLNYLFRLPFVEPQELELWQPGDTPRPRTRIVSLEELCAGKLCAALDRAAPRDLYDVARLPAIAGEAWRRPLLRRLFVAISGVLPLPLHQYGSDRLDRVTEEAVQSQLHPMLSRSDRPTAATLRRAAWDVLGPLVQLDEAERDFTDRLQIGDLKPELLFPDDPELAERILRHPALLWKAHNARQQKNRQGKRE